VLTRITQRDSIEESPIESVRGPLRSAIGQIGGFFHRLNDGTLYKAISRDEISARPSASIIRSLYPRDGRFVLMEYFIMERLAMSIAS